MAEEVFDVAISFLVRDEPTATVIAERLEGAGLKVFFFPHRQEELAGTNGTEIRCERRFWRLARMSCFSGKA